MSKSYHDYVLNVSANYEPEFFHQAVKYPEWCRAMADEIAALETNHTWSVQSLPPGKKPTGCRWLYNVKYKADGSLDKYMDQLVAKGYAQQAGIDFTESFSPVAKLATVRVLLAIAAQKKWSQLQLDINNAFLNRDLDEEVFMQLPLGYHIKGENLVYKLNKSLSGLRQASRQWYSKFSSTVLLLGFQQSSADSSLFTKGTGSSLIILIVYVDDILLAGPNATLIHQTRKSLEAHFKLKVVGDLHYFLGLEIAHSPQGISLCQRKYTLQLLHDTGFLAAKPLPTPMDPNISLNDIDGDPLTDPTQYKRLLGRLIYLTISRPDIAYSVNRLSQFMQKPRTTLLQAAHHILQYLKKSPRQGLLFPISSPLKVHAYSDADWGSCPHN